MLDDVHALLAVCRIDARREVQTLNESSNERGEQLHTPDFTTDVKLMTPDFLGANLAQGNQRYLAEFNPR